VAGGSDDRLSRLIWHDKDHLQIGDVNFHVTLEQAIADAVDSTSDRFLLVKNQFLMQSAIERLPRRVDSMIEFGIYKGGSIALYEELLSPSRLVGVDIKTDRVTRSMTIWNNVPRLSESSSTTEPTKRIGTLSNPSRATTSLIGPSTL
jgi:hypothetical protein